MSLLFKKSRVLASFLLTVLVLAGCGGGESGGSAPSTSYRGYFVDSPVKGLEYSGDMGSGGITDDEGSFSFYDRERVTFRVGSVTLGSVRMEASENIVTPVTLVSDAKKGAVGAADESVLAIVRFLMSADSGYSNRFIDISDSLRRKLSQKSPSGSTGSPSQMR